MTYSSKTTCPDRVLPSTSGFFFSERRSKVFTRHTSHCTLRTPNFKLHTPHFTLHTSHFTLHSPHFPLLTSHCFLHTPNLTLHTSHFTLRSSHSKLKLHTPHFTLHTPHFTLLTSHCFLHTSHFTLHSSRPTLHTALNLRPTKKRLVPKWRKSANKSISQPSCSHSKTISEIQLQKTIVLRMQPQHEATLTQRLQCDLQRLSCKTQ